ncbi:hypothetical protein PSH03_003997 [Micromonospora sp. PSH03]|uniref:hypothetical protein n=1 Tax=Micromonospora TaxID=1873 RepID=UPI001B385630|nr:MULTISPECIES: hypothetical protein [Micromonospora]MBQ0988620.1 hypothetical protein [Micromonospora sp. H61]MCG5454833.1 hypothetical protein [Micromonospora salmantinae]
MTDNLGPLRQALSDLSEHGGTADMYERALRKSRQSQRRTALTTGAAAAAVVFAIGGTVALATRHRPDPPTAPASTPTSDGRQNPTCPSTQALGTLVELPAGWSFASRGVECVETWAAADVQRPDASGVIYLFHYTAGTGWRFQDQGTGWECKDLGLTEPASFCTS